MNSCVGHLSYYCRGGAGQETRATAGLETGATGACCRPRMDPDSTPSGEMPYSLAGSACSYGNSWVSVSLQGHGCVDRLPVGRVELRALPLGHSNPGIAGQDEAEEVLVHPVMLAGVEDDSQELARESDDSLAAGAPALNATIEVLEEGWKKKPADRHEGEISRCSSSRRAHRAFLREARA